MPVSKTDFIRGLQCPKMLWLDSHSPQLRVIPPEVQKRLDEGNDFGDNAMGIFGEFVETTAYKEDGRLNYSQMLENTKRLLENQAPIVCEAAFSWYGNYCAVDILKREGLGYSLYEVKNSPAPKKEFVLDLAFQRFLLKKSGVPVLFSKLILPFIESETEKQTGQVQDELITHNETTYRIVDVTQAAARAERLAEKHIFPFGKIKAKAAACPLVEVGEQCRSPYECWYFEHCHKKSE